MVLESLHTDQPVCGFSGSSVSGASVADLASAFRMPCRMPSTASARYRPGGASTSASHEPTVQPCAVVSGGSATAAPLAVLQSVASPVCR